MSLSRLPLLAVFAASAAAADHAPGSHLGETDVAPAAFAFAPPAPRMPWQVASVLPGAGADETAVAAPLAAAAPETRRPWSVASVLPGAGADETAVAASVHAAPSAAPRVAWQVAVILPGAGLDETSVAPPAQTPEGVSTRRAWALIDALPLPGETDVAPGPAVAAVAESVPWTVAAVIVPKPNLNETDVAPAVHLAAPVEPRSPWLPALATRVALGGPSETDVAPPVRASVADIMTEMAEADPALEITRDADGEVDGMVMLSDVLFDYAVSDLKPEALRTLAAVASKLDGVGALEVVGHTDDVGSRTYNAELGQARAEAVRDWLVGEGHLDEARVIAVSAGELEPLSPNDSAEARALNRRVAFRVVDAQ